MMTDFIKLSGLVNDTFTVEKVWGYKWKKWDTNENKMLVADRYEQDYQKKWDVDTNKGKLDLSPSQYGAILEAVSKDGIADLNGRTINVKSNGKTGMEIRYYFNAIGDVKPLPDAQLNGGDKVDGAPPLGDEDVPF